MPKYKVTNEVDGDEDPLYVEADDENEALNRVHDHIGPVPRSVLTFTEIDAVPEGEDLLN